MNALHCSTVTGLIMPCLVYQALTVTQFDPSYILPLMLSASRNQAVVPVLSAAVPCHEQHPGASPFYRQVRIFLVYHGTAPRAFVGWV
ncbi:hypothetical protein F5B22DRAFT_625819 [Xylaria bambusicola]|uniref:uncharacterized protein n=1 Tax=Xylaria bambusicola TaxID=326684 RepID=UPI002007E7D1|nr:uncharacterized protein F5B22DRAFT_625819 [Xylaria bambusicola]KAI0506002.1 hypothetical protein F5B22DRAFT_625819 [Xylaria bambusicola]